MIRIRCRQVGLSCNRFDWPDMFVSPRADCFSTQRPRNRGSANKWGVAILAAAAVMLLPAHAADSVDYLRDIKPLLSETCYRCHGVNQKKGGLRLDTAAFALKGGDTGPALKPSNSSESLMIQAVLGTHPDISRMPYKKP